MRSFIEYAHRFSVSTGITNQKDILHHLEERPCDLDSEKLQSILKYLHRIGIIMWYIEIPALHDMVFAKPAFLISLFKVC